MGQDTPEGGRSPLASPTFLVAALLVVALVIGGMWVVLGRDSSPAGTSPVVSGASTSSSTGGVDAQSDGDVAASGDSASACGLEDSDRSVPSAALPTVPLAVGEGVEVPSLPGVGPGLTGGVSSCFAHTPTGAVLAGANFMKWFSSKHDLPDVVTTLMVPSGDRDRLEEQVRAEWSGETGSAVNIRGYHFEDWGPDNALVVLAVSTPAYPNDLVAWPLAMVWVEGDWKVTAPTIDSWGERSIQSLQLEGFVEWGA